jgi:hypothetical protein
LDRKQIANNKNLRSQKQKNGNNDIEIDLYDPLEELGGLSDLEQLSGLSNEELVMEL